MRPKIINQRNKTYSSAIILTLTSILLLMQVLPGIATAATETATTATTTTETAPPAKTNQPPREIDGVTDLAATIVTTIDTTTVTTTNLDTGTTTKVTTTVTTAVATSVTATTAPAAAASTTGNTIQIPIGQQSEQLSQLARPQRGMTERQVIDTFGEPLKQSIPTGTPPISQWAYANFIVYFESKYVIHSVLKHKKRAE